MPGLLTVLPSLFTLFGKIFGVDMTSDDAKVKLVELQVQAESLVSAELTGQMKVNEAEAAAPNRTWPTWREQLGFLCTWSIGLNIILQIVAAVAASLGIKFIPPVLETQQLVVLLTGMLGLHVTDSVFNSPKGVAPDAGIKKGPQNGSQEVESADD